MASLTTLVARMRYWCTEANLGYDQAQRWDIRPGGEADCSSLVIHALKEAGFDTGGATYTGNMRAALTARGWAVVAVRPTSAANLRAGDILLNDANHVALYLGGGQLAQASIDERGRVAGGQSGDQTNYETNVRSFYVYAHGGWSAVLRWTGAKTAPQSMPIQPGATTYNPNGYGADYVRDVQSRLVELGYSVGASGTDGILGADTFNAVKAYQAAAGLTVDGIPGPDTVGALKAGRASRKAQASVATPQAAAPAAPAPLDVRAIQRAVHVTADNVVGPVTRRAVYLVAMASAAGGRRYPDGVAATQRAVGTPADGIWGPASDRAHDATVAAIQTALRALGYDIAVDSVWGGDTEGAIRDALNRGRQA